MYEPLASTCITDGSTTTCTYTQSTTTPLQVSDGATLFGIEVIAFIMMVGFVAFLFNGFGGSRKR